MILPGRGRRFVPGVAAGICRRPIDRPSAETHPPNNSMNVSLVNSLRPVGSGSSGAFVSLLLAGFLQVPLIYKPFIE